MQVPLIPESAPFTPSQRAWLNGFFAGLLNIDPASASTGSASEVIGISGGGGGATALAEPPPQAPSAEEVPWHDSTIALPDRMKLAEGKPVHLRLMAAMAQLDCGACGYECASYSKAIADGAEKDLTRCVPGGADTARMLKRITKEAPGAAPTPSISAPSPSPAPSAAAWDRANPFPATILAIKRLNREGSDKDTRFVALDLATSGLAYEPGDSLGLFPTNDASLVQSILQQLSTTDAALADQLTHRLNITRLDEDTLRLFAEAATDSAQAQALAAMADDESAADGWDLLDLLTRFPSARPAPAQLTQTLKPLQPRLYSISSSLKAHPDEVHLTVGVVRYESLGRSRGGVASTFLADRTEEGRTVPVFIQKSHGFRLPVDGQTPIIMVGPGTGIAPFRAFLEHRKASSARGPSWLFFGDQRRECDFLYEHELRHYLETGQLTRLDTAFSRDQAEKIYVQTRMIEQAPELWTWLDRGAHFYVCGDAKRMAKDVDLALKKIVQTQSGRTAAQAEDYVRQMAKTGRYLRDVY